MLNNSQISLYLERLGIQEKPNPDLKTLIKIHRAHLLNIPFENLSIHNNEKIILNLESLFEKIIMKKRGGFCYELNGLFFSLLNSLGFECKMISARVFDEQSKLGPEFDHMAIISSFGNDQWLCDVGFGDSFIQPIKLILNSDQIDYKRIYRIEKFNNDEFLLSRSNEGVQWKNQYLFTLSARTLEEFIPMCNYHQTSPESHFTQKKVCSIAAKKGRITLRDDRLIITEGKIKKEYFFETKEMFNTYLTQYFNIII